jgi:hypothetical protein
MDQLRLMKGAIGKLASVRVERHTNGGRIRELNDWIETVKSDLESLASHIEETKRTNKKRRDDLQRRMTGLKEMRERLKSQHQNGLSERFERYVQVNQGLRHARKRLISDLVSIFSLRRLKKDADLEDFRIVNVTFPVGGDFWNYSPDECNTGVSYIIQMTKQSAEYLGVRLPFEMEFEGLKSYARASYPDTLDTGQMPLQLVPTSNQGNGDLFLIGFSMLNYNVAYLCFTQGIRIHSNDVSNTLKNLYLALSSPHLARDLSPPVALLDQPVAFYANLENSFTLDFVKCVKLLAAKWPGSFQSEEKNATFLDRFADDALLNRIKGSMVRANTRTRSSALYLSVAFECADEAPMVYPAQQDAVGPTNKREALRQRSDLLEGEESEEANDWLVL